MAILAERFRATMNSDGLWAAMRWLNDQVPYRFSAIFAFEGDMPRNICFVDKSDASVRLCTDQPLAESYCIYIQRSGEQFSVEDAMADDRVAGHPKRSSYPCYYGIPLLSVDGHLPGTECHFDPALVRVTEDVVEALDDLASLIAETAFPAPRRP